jgi:hypothetical protein
MFILTLYNIIKYTLATTIVEECNNEDTGVGPSMATGNQYPHKYKELLHKMATTSKRIINSPTIWYITTRKTKSLTRLYIIADIAPLFLLGRIQYLINNIDMTPIPSHLKNINTLIDVNIKIINPKKINITNLKLSIDTSSLM